MVRKEYRATFINSSNFYSHTTRYAVEEWINSGLNFHVMRDHANGHSWAIMAGMWGAVGNAHPAKELYKANVAYAKDDQTFLHEVMWGSNLWLQLGHDSQFCVSYFAIPFPSPSWIHFVGQTPRYDHPPSPDNPQCESLRYNEFLA
jgi:hypothetical protein